ncbi:MAG: DUF1343 domain-containing protein [Tannerella sp.]|nr:DUF1343 domain-containing protein [Tannerella sp.]
MMNRYILSGFLFTVLLMIGETVAAQTYNTVIVGAERMDTLLLLLKDKRVGLAVNHTSILVKTNTHLLDALLVQGVDVVRIFAPEHGFRGTEDAGANVKNHSDAKTGIPIVSLYGKNYKPTAAQIRDLDVIVFDIQDVGARFYTYISTMHYLMEACAEQQKEFVVLDRPNPNDYVDGPVRKNGYKSFVGMHPIPLLHGLTIGELAQMINGEGWLQSGMKYCPLTVVKMLNWRHGDPYRLPVKPSPNLPNEQSIRLYPSLCLFEGTCISVGRGTYFPFQAIGYPDPKAGDFTFTPVAIVGLDTQPMYRNILCYGADLRNYPFKGGLTLRFILDFYNRLGKNGKLFFSRANWFDLLAGVNVLRTQILSGYTEEEIRATWQSDLEHYKEVRKKYLLYRDYGEWRILL